MIYRKMDNDNIDIAYIYQDSYTEKYPEVFVILDVNIKTLSYQKLKNILCDDGVEIEKISEIQYYSDYSNEYIFLSESALGKIRNQESIKRLKLRLILKKTQKKIESLIKRVEAFENEIKLNPSPLELSIKKTDSSINFCDFEKNNLECNYDVDLIFLYANPLKDTNRNDIEDNHMQLIDLMYKIMRRSPMKINAQFDVLNDFSFVNACIKCPKILHISSACSSGKFKNNEQQYFIIGEFNGEPQKMNRDELIIRLKLETKNNVIELVVLTLQYSQDLGKIFFESGIQNVICFNFDESKKNLDSHTHKLLKIFYKLIFEGETVDKAFSATKKADNLGSVFIYKKEDFSPAISFSRVESKGNSANLTINDECFINLDYNDDILIRMIGRNEKLIQVYQAYKNYHKHLIFLNGEPHIGKKFFAKKVGKFLFERKVFFDVKYIEIAERVSIEEIKKKLNAFGKEGSSKKILLIIAIEFQAVENAVIDMVFELKEKYKNLAFMIVTNSSCNLENITLTLEKLKAKNASLLFNYLLQLTNNQAKINTKNKQKIISQCYGIPFNFFLRVEYLRLFPFSNVSELKSNEKMIENIVKEGSPVSESEKIIFVLFSLLQKGISKADLEELNANCNEVKVKSLLISSFYSYKAMNFFYVMNNTFCSYIIKFASSKTLDFCLRRVLSVYSKIFRNAITTKENPQFRFNFLEEFNAGINQGIWLTLNTESFEKYFAKEKNVRIFSFQDYYYDNVFIILTNKVVVDRLKFLISQKDSEVIEYFEQISICLPTIIFKLNKWKEAESLINVLLIKSSEFGMKENQIRLLLFLYHIKKDENLKTQIDHLLETSKFEKDYLLIKLSNKKYSETSQSIFKACNSLLKNDLLGLCKLNFIMARVTQNENYIVDEIIAKTKDSKIIMGCELEKAKIYFNQHKYTEAEKILKGIQLKSLKSKENFFKNEIDALYNDIKEKLSKIPSNVLVFAEANMLICDICKEEIISYCNDAYNFRNKLIGNLPQKLEINFSILTEETLSLIINQPTSFLYINSDDFDNKGLLYVETAEGKNKTVSFDELKKILNDHCNSYAALPTLVVLAFINSDMIANLFISRGYPNVIYLPKNNWLNECLLEDRSKLLFFRECVKKFVVELLLKLCEGKNLGEAFILSSNSLLSCLASVISSLKIEDQIIKLESKNKDIFMFEELERKETISVFGSIVENEEDFQKDEIKKIKAYHNHTAANETKIEITYPSSPETYNKKITEYKRQIFDVVNLVKRVKLVNIYGDSIIDFSFVNEVCKYFYMRNYFNEGIFYINAQKIKFLKKIQIIKKLAKSTKEYNKLFILDHADKCIMKKDNFKYLGIVGIHYVLITQSSISNEIFEKYWFDKSSQREVDEDKGQKRRCKRNKLNYN